SPTGYAPQAPMSGVSATVSPTGYAPQAPMSGVSATVSPTGYAPQAPMSGVSAAVSPAGYAPQAPMSGVSAAVSPAGYVQNGVVLPPELAMLYRLNRIDSVLPGGVIGSVVDVNGGTESFGIKFFFPKNDVERAVFNEGIRRLEALSRENNTFESVLFHFPESCAFLVPDMPRQSLVNSIATNGVFQPAVAAQAGLLIAQGMEFAHQHGIVNGNLKPSNLMFEKHSGVVMPVIYDLGQRLYIDSVAQIPVADIPFIAPELNYNLQNTNAQADIFAFGMCMIYMLMGRLPYVSDNKDALLAEIRSYREAPQLQALMPGLDSGLAQVIQWCINFDPSGRYVRFSDVNRDLYVVYQNLLQSV
ncbi:MAG: protein kinase, partial [Proteobacteria bacterium]|nr:protein kinase [Pseudomonadota bacterium]